MRDHLQIHEYGSLKGLSRRDLPEPMLGPREAVVSVRARTINYRDLLIREGNTLAAGAPDVVPLSDGAGEVVAIRADVTRVKVGDRVAATYFPRWRAGLLKVKPRWTSSDARATACWLGSRSPDEEALVPLAAPSHTWGRQPAMCGCDGVVGCGRRAPASRCPGKPYSRSARAAWRCSPSSLRSCSARACCDHVERIESRRPETVRRRRGDRHR